MVPLIIQLGLIAKFMQLYEQSEKALASSDRYGEVTQTLFEMNARMFRLTEAFFGVKLNIRTAKSAYKLVTRVNRDFDEPIAKLKELSKDDSQSMEILSQLIGIRNDLSTSYEKLASEVLLGPEGVDKAMVAKQFSAVMHGAAVTLPELERSLQKLAYEKNQEVKRLKVEQRWTIAIFAVIDFGFAIVAVIALLTSTSSKLKKLRQNVENYAHDKPLSPPSEGSDEIDVIDQAFHDTASKLRVLHRKERALIYDSQDPIVFLDTRFKILFANHSASAVFNEQSSFFDYVEPSAIEVVANFLQDVSRGLERNNLEVELLFETRRRVILSAVLEPEENSILCIIHDITARHEVESIRQEIVSMFTHDLRNPLTSLTLALDSLSEKSELASYSTTFKRAQGNVRRMTDLIRDLLDLYKTDAGMMQFEKGAFSASRLCDEALAEVVDSAEHLHVTLRKSLAEELDVLGDQKCTLRVVVNLLSNAIKFSPPGSVVELRVRLMDNKVAFQVVDSGPGIPIEEQPFVFARFQQVSTSKSSRLPGLGSGLGLAICKAFSERQGGSIMLSSKLGAGSVFTCVLPRSL